MNFRSCGESSRQLLDGVHLWLVDLRADLAWDAYEGALSFDEQARGDRFHFKRDRDRYCRCRSALRSILSIYSDIAPRLFRFSYGEHGKPEIAAEMNPENLQFNVSHSGNYALIGIVRQLRIGIDIEEERSNLMLSDLIKSCLSTEECRRLSTLSSHEQLPEFYRIWALKEALVKALGQGLSVSLTDFSIPVWNESSSIPVAVPAHFGQGNWCLWWLQIVEGYSTAICLEGKPTQLRIYSWPTGQSLSCSASLRCRISGNRVDCEQGI